MSTPLSDYTTCISRGGFENSTLSPQFGLYHRTARLTQVLPPLLETCHTSQEENCSIRLFFSHTSERKGCMGRENTLLRGHVRSGRTLRLSFLLFTYCVDLSVGTLRYYLPATLTLCALLPDGVRASNAPILILSFRKHCQLMIPQLQTIRSNFPLSHFFHYLWADLMTPEIYYSTRETF